MTRMTPAQTARFRITACFGWGLGLVVVGMVLRWVLLWSTTSVDTADGAYLLAQACLLLVLAGLALLAVGLVAIGVQLGLAAYGVEQR